MAGLPPLTAALWSLIATVLAQAANKDSAAALRIAADAVAAQTRAVAVSLLCVDGGVSRARTGDWPPDAQPKLDAWERGLIRCAQQGAMALPSGPVPVSTARIAGWVVCNIPLAAGDQVMGALTLCLEAGRAPEAAAAARDLSPWLGTLLRAFHGLELANRRLGALGMILHAGGAMADAEDIRTSLRNTLRLAARLVNADGCLVVTLSDDGGCLRCQAADVPNQAVDWTGARIKVGGILGHVSLTGETVVSNDPVSDSRYAPDVEGALLEPLTSLLAVPLHPQGAPHGALAALNRRDPLGFTSDDAWLLESVAAHVAVYLENARLYSAVREERQRIAKVEQSIRAEVASNLHQGAIQMLAAVTMGLDHLEHLAVTRPEDLLAELKSLKELTREATREARLLLFELRPTILESEGLLNALQAYIQQIPNGDEIVHFTHEGALSELDALTAQVAFSVVVQGLRHARQHGQSSNVWLNVAMSEETLAITVEDDGKPHSERRCTSHDEGLDCPTFMQDRVTLVRGLLRTRDGSLEERAAIQIRIPISAL